MNERDLSPAQLLERLRAGDAEAATEFVRRYEPEIRRAVHVRLTDPRLRRVFDSMDICQSVLAGFFQYLNTHDVVLERPEQLLHLLITMTRHKLLDEVREQTRACRDRRRHAPGNGDALEQVAAPTPGPDRVLLARDLLEQVRQRLPEEDRYLVEQRALGREWSDLAAELGSTPEALRKRMARVLDRLLAQMGGPNACHL